MTENSDINKKGFFQRSIVANRVDDKSGDLVTSHCKAYKNTLQEIISNHNIHYTIQLTLVVAVPVAFAVVLELAFVPEVGLTAVAGATARGRAVAVAILTVFLKEGLLFVISFVLFKTK